MPIFLSVIITIAVTKIAINVTNVPTLASNTDSQILRDDNRMRSEVLEQFFSCCCKFQSKVLKFSHYIIFTPTVTIYGASCVQKKTAHDVHLIAAGNFSFLLLLL